MSKMRPEASGDAVGIPGDARSLWHSDREVDHSVQTASRAKAFFRSERERWQARYVRRLMVTDFVIVCTAVALAHIVRFGGFDEPELDGAQVSWFGYTVVSIGLVLIWTALLALFNTRSPRIIGSGTEEYLRIAAATFRLFGVVAIVSLLLNIGIARGYLAIAFPLGMVGLLLGRRVWRVVAARKRARGEYQTSVLVVGNTAAVPDVADAFVRDSDLGYHVVGLCTPKGPTDNEATMAVRGVEIPIVGVDNNVIDAVKLTHADTVALTATDHLRPEQIRRLVWDLDALGVDLIVTPGVVDVAGARLRTRPVASMPMLHIEKPQYDRAKSLGKRAFDVVFATLALLAVLPVLVLSAIAIKATSRGPVFYKSERVGLNGKPFRMIKFRSMSVDADRHLDALIESNGGNPLFFKLKNDPRITPVGHVLRKYSLDELPQFINVLRGEMSVVGPRPQVRGEVETYDDLVWRRLFVKPGVTGLWQVSGRSDLPVAEAVRLDLSYVENWSMVQDLLIIVRTITTVTRGDGAY